MMARLGVVSGLLAETRCLEVRISSKIEVIAFATGARSGRAHEGAERMVRSGATALASFGFAGALAPGLRPGALVVPSVIIAPNGERYDVDPEWRARLVKRVGAVEGGALLGSGTPLATVRDKTRAQHETGAVAVDMESHEVALAAREAGVPFLAIRSISDAADMAIPSAALRAVSPEGGRDTLGALLGLVQAPWELIALLRLARDSQKALVSLRRVARLSLGNLALDAEVRQ
jgi:adenosylhomocysteine nucleosidase